MIETSEQKPFLLGEIAVSPQHNKLSLQGRSLALQPKVMAVLCYLAKHQDRVVSSEELLDKVWAGRVVTHASVQKSINALRNALSELAGEGEFVAHFSKRGYQLLLPVIPLVQDAQPSSTAAVPVAVPSRISMKLPLALSLAAIFTLSLAAILWLMRESPAGVEPVSLQKNHLLKFSSSAGFTSETGHERDAEPHPDGQRVAYVRDIKEEDRTQSHLMIRDDAGRDWMLAGVEGSWIDMAWSPSGRNLVAVEMRRAEGLPWTPGYYENANYLYSFHIFTLDFRGERLLEKNLLSQWQGVVESVTWWDDNTLEFIASLGPSSDNERYRYRIADQRLTTLSALDGGFLPVKSTIRDKMTALVSHRRGDTQLNFLDAKQQPVATWLLPARRVDISWIPDGSGVLIFDSENKKLSAFYLDGQNHVVDAKLDGDLEISHPRYKSDGKTILVTATAPKSEFSLLGMDGEEKRIHSRQYRNDLPVFSSDGESIYFASLRHGRHQLWRWHKGMDEQLAVLPSPPLKLLAQAEEGSLLIDAAGSVWRQKTGDRAPSLLWEQAGRWETLAYEPSSRQLWFIRNINDARNIWLRNLGAEEERQLTFGSVGTALYSAGKVYFQYAGQRGLWALDGKQNAVQISGKLPENSRLLHMDQQSVYFVTGGPCRESHLQRLDLATAAMSVVIQQENRAAISQDFHPSSGVLQTRCALPESNIIQLSGSN